MTEHKKSFKDNQFKKGVIAISKYIELNTLDKIGINIKTSDYFNFYPHHNNRTKERAIQPKLVNTPIENWNDIPLAHKQLLLNHLKTLELRLCEGDIPLKDVLDYIENKTHS